MIHLRPLFIANALLLVFTTNAQTKSPFTYQDMLMLDRISGLAVDPAGTTALFNVRATDMEKNRGVSTLWMKDLMDLKKPEVKVPAGEGGASDVQWAADGSGFYFLSGRGEGGLTQVWKADAKGTNATQVTRLPLDVQTYRVAPDGSGVVVALSVFPDCGDDAITCTLERLKAQQGVKSTGQVYDRIFMRHWDSWKDGTRDHLYYLSLKEQDAKPIALMNGFDGDVPSKPFGGNEDFAIGKDGRTVYFSARIAGKKEPWSTNFDLYSVPVTGGTPTNLTASNPAWDASPVISPDGTRLAYKAMKRPGYEADRFQLKVMDLTTGAVTDVAAAWDRSAASLAWSRDGKSLLVTADDLGKHRLFRIDLKTSTVTPLSTDGHMDAFVETPKAFVFQKSGLSGPAQLYASAPKAKLIDQGATVLTQVNAGLANKAFGAYEQFSFPGWNNETVYGYVLKPSNYTEGRKCPVAFLIHGGPQGSFGDGWSYRWNPQTYAGQGYAVVMIDFHGSTGYGQAFTDAINEHWGDRPLEDLQKGLAFALGKYPFLDGGNVAALGASYGGFMINWIAGVWNEPFKALVSHCGIFDTRAMGYSTEELWFTDWENGGSVFSKPANYETFNPLLHADKWRVPMLVVHGDKDFRVPLTQGIGSFTACQAKGIESKYLRFPDENHWVLKPQNSMQWHREVFGWLEKHIGGGR
ncbi:MAG TPA: S9 family peptidase [Flavobacteriales bacterium]|nr:S9 family peptidase [Flavobacteriales bacterium]